MSEKLGPDKAPIKSKIVEEQLSDQHLESFNLVRKRSQFAIYASVDGGPSGGSRVHRPERERRLFHLNYMDLSSSSETKTIFFNKFILHQLSAVANRVLNLSSVHR